MKVRIKSGDCPAYLTIGGVYKVSSPIMGIYSIGDDYGLTLHVDPFDGSWEILK